MLADYKGLPEELDVGFIEAIRAIYKNRPIHISIRELDENDGEVDATEYLLSNEANREFLLEAV